MSKEIRIRLGSSAVGQNLAEYLARQGYPIHADCGGKGKCGKCQIKLVSGYLYANAACTQLATPDKDGLVLACRTWCCSGAVIVIPAFEGEGLTDFSRQVPESESTEIIYGVALDVGTTTLAAALVNTKTGQVLASASALNPQAAFGADVISRIDAVMQHSEALVQMQRLLLDEVRKMLGILLPDAQAAHMAVAGNPTMLHIFCGISPTSMGAYPFTPVFTQTQKLSGAALRLPVDTVTVLPSISAFVGGDVTAGMTHCSLTDSPSPVLLVDIGTNGECVLFTGTKNGSRLYAASAAAGPAMEGAGISTGMGGVAGAVCSVRMQQGRPLCATVGDLPAKGICGSGLIDLAAALYRDGMIDETGAFEQGESFVYATTADGLPLSLTQADIRALQLAKSAIRAAIEALCAHAGLQPRDLDRIYLAGGLGHYMNVDCATAIGLLPQGVCVTSLGNAALGGCVRVLTDPALIKHMEQMAEQCQTLELSTDVVWSQAFMEHMMFPCEDEI
ncbi:MAG: DUF4445 domain-containing protein [Clostridia bacterium]|nr:DUF4445 domain-containing protein [Clostridia bacterium]